MASQYKKNFQKGVSAEFMQHLREQLSSTILPHGDDKNRRKRQVWAALKAFDNLKPANEIEAILAMQMVVLNESFVTCTKRANTSADPVTRVTYQRLAVKINQASGQLARNFADIRYGPKKLMSDYDIQFMTAYRKQIQQQKRFSA